MINNIFKSFNLKLFLICFLYGHVEGTQVYRSFEFDLAGNLKEVTTSDNCSITYEYDQLQQLSKVSDSDGRIFQYQYDPNGNCTQIEDKHGVTKYEYDLLNKLITVSYPGIVPLRYFYDHRGRLQHIVYPGGIGVSYSYDAADRLITAYFLDGKVEYIYDQAMNTLSKIIFPNGITTEYGYDKAKRVISVFHKRSDKSLIIGFQYKFDGNGNRVRTEEIAKEVSKVTEYSYDKLNRVINVTYPDGYEKYTYDALGNRLTKETPSGLIKYEYDQNNCLIKAGDSQFFYDGRGNLIKKIRGDNTTEYVYDVYDNLIEYRDNEYKISYSYDAEGRRLSKSVNGEITFYVNDIHSPIPQILIEARGDYSIKNFYIYGLSRLCQFHLPGEGCQFYLYDYPDRNVMAITDMRQQLCNRYSYEAFGSIKSAVCTDFNNFTFAGEHYEEETGLIYLRNRYYDPEIGRFLSPDPRLGKPTNTQSFNPYAYVENNPINFIDPLGLKSAEFCAYPVGTITEHGKSATGHGFWLLTRDNGDMIAIGRYPRGSQTIDRIVPGTVSFKVPATDAQIDAIISRVSHGIYLGIAGNCIDGLEWGLEILGLEHPSFNVLGISMPSKAVIWIESLNGTDDFKRAMEQDLRFVAEPDLLSPAVRFTPSVIKPEFLGSAKLAGDLGGISFEKTAQVIGSFSDIVGATYDFSTGQLILVGTQNYSLPPMDFDDLAVVIRSIYGLGGKPPQSPGISIDWNPDNNKKIRKNKLDHLHPMPVRYEGVTEGTHFGQVMFEADRILKCLTFGTDNITGQPFRANVPGYKALQERYSDPHVKVSLEPQLMYRMWFIPKEIRLIKSPDGRSIVFDQVQMGVLTETFKKQEYRENQAAEDFATHFTSHFDEFARQYPVLAELKRLSKITGIVKWLKENNIPVDLSLFSQYTPRPVPTASTTPAIVSGCERSSIYTPIIGGVTYHLCESNFHEIFGNIAESLLESVIHARPSEDRMEWDMDQSLGNGLKAVAHTIEKTRKVGNIQKTFVDIHCLVPGELSLELLRYYNSFNERSSGFGKGWEVSPASLNFPRKRCGVRWETSNITKEIFTEIFVFEQGKEYCFKLQGLNTQALPIYYSKENTAFLVEQENGYFTLRKEADVLFFDSTGKLVQKVDVQGKSLLFSYDADRLVSITHQNGKKIELEYQNGRIVRANGPEGKTVYYQYNGDGQLECVADQMGIIVCYSYDSEQNLNAMYDAKRNLLFEASYDHYHRAISLTKGKVSTKRQFSLKDHAAKIQGPNNIEIFSQYDSDYRLLQTSDSLGRSIELSYQNGTFQPAVIKDSFGHEFHYSYDSRGNISSIRNKAGIEWKFWYDSSNRLIVSLDGRGRAQIYQYDEKGRLKCFLPCSCLTKEDPTTGQIFYRYLLNEAMEYEYDPETSTVSAIKKGNELVRKISYDTEGRIIEVSDPYGYKIQRTYDERSRLKKCADSKGGFEYDYNERDQVIKMSSPVACMSYNYDEVGNLIRIKDGNGNETHLEYDENYNLIAVIDAEGGITRYGYNNFHCLTQIILPNGSSKTIVYDDLNRPIQELIGK